MQKEESRSIAREHQRCEREADSKFWETCSFIEKCSIKGKLQSHKCYFKHNKKKDQVFCFLSVKTLLKVGTKSVLREEMISLIIGKKFKLSTGEQK